jgi:hypothetical protein
MTVVARSSRAGRRLGRSLPLVIGMPLLAVAVSAACWQPAAGSVVPPAGHGPAVTIDPRLTTYASRDVVGTRPSLVAQDAAVTVRSTGSARQLVAPLAGDAVRGGRGGHGGEPAGVGGEVIRPQALPADARRPFAGVVSGVDTAVDSGHRSTTAERAPPQRAC